MTKYPSSNEVLHAWLRGVNAGRVDDVLALYADEAILLATFSPHAMRTPATRRLYFEQLATRSGLNVSLHEKTLRTQAFAAEIEVLSGIYCFRFEIDAEPFSFEARFSMLVNRAVPQPLFHHHSSQIPRTLT